MLKIKDNIDLKELEKFGFEKTDGAFDTYYAYEELLVRIKNKEIVLFKVGKDALIKFFDLCQAGLVEKVVEDE